MKGFGSEQIWKRKDNEFGIVNRVLEQCVQALHAEKHVCDLRKEGISFPTAAGAVGCRVIHCSSLSCRSLEPRALDL